MLRNSVQFTGRKGYMENYVLFKEKLKRSTRHMRVQRTRERHANLRAYELSTQVACRASGVQDAPFETAAEVNLGDSCVPHSSGVPGESGLNGTIGMETSADVNLGDSCVLHSSVQESGEVNITESLAQPGCDGLDVTEVVHGDDEAAPLTASATQPDHEPPETSLGNPYYAQTTEEMNAAPEISDGPVVGDYVQSEFEWSRLEKERLCAPVCQCSGVTVGDCLFMSLTVGFKHNLSWDAQVDVLRLLATVSGCKEMPCSKTAYFNYIDKLKHAINFQIFCPECGVYLGEKNPNSNGASGENAKSSNRNKAHRPQKQQQKVFHCKSCNEIVDPCKASNFFVSVSVEEQLKTIMADEQFAENLVTHRFQRQRRHDVLSDIYDGAEYKKHCGEGGILKSKFNFSWPIFTDGISTGRSTGKTMWPIYLSLNEAPKKDRHKYIILAGLYVGNKDPNPWFFFEPILKEMNKLSQEGFTWIYQGSQVVSRVIPLLMVTDSVARYQLLNMQQYFAFYGCTFCYQVQEATAPKKRRFDAFSAPAPLRTAQSTRRDAVDAHERAEEHIAANRTVKGVRGPSVLIKLKCFDLIRGFAVDPMHAIFLGLIKTHMEYLFDSMRSKFWVNKNTGVEERMRLIDQRLLKITPPTGITRNTRSMSTFKLWKASEWRTWLLFYCIPCLKGFLKQKHLAHIAQLSKATCLLLQESVTLGDIAESRHLFEMYAQGFQTYFDVKHTIYNLHLLRHVPSGVENFGPLWTHDAFPFEGQNRHVLQLLTGYNHAVYQVTRRFLIFTSLPRLYRDFVTTDRVDEFAERTLSRKFRRYDKCGGYVLTGKEERGLAQEMIDKIKVHCEIPPNVTAEMQLYKRVILNRMRFTVAEYVGDKQNNDSYVFLKGCRYALHITDIVHVACEEFSINSVIVIGEKIRLSKEPLVESSRVSLTHMQKVRRVGGIMCTDMTSIESQGVIMSVDDEQFIGMMVYGCYGD